MMDKVTGEPFAAWRMGRLRIRPDVVWDMAISSLKLRLSRSVLTLLTITTSTAFLMYLLTAPRTGEETEAQSWTLMVVLAMVVSAAGVLNTMLMSVGQRYREIGTMKCLGALDSFVLFSVVLEAAILGLAGSALGLLAGLVVSTLLAVADHGFAFAGHLRLGALPAKCLFVFAVGAGLTTGAAAVPAWIASKMPPMDAMRGEK